MREISVQFIFCLSPLQKLLIAQIKMVLRVLFLYIPLPMFWTLFDQKVFKSCSYLGNHWFTMAAVLDSESLLKGSRWTLQATNLNGNFVSLMIKPTTNIFQSSTLFKGVHVLITYLCLQGLLVIQPDQMQVS